MSGERRASDPWSGGRGGYTHEWGAAGDPLSGGRGGDTPVR